MILEHCPVCGFPFSGPVDEEALCDSYDVCQCCGCEYGYDDNARYREEWIAQGAPFHHTERPANWNLKEQLKNIVPDWPDPLYDLGSSSQALVCFYRDRRVAGAPYRLSDIWEFSFEELENRHDYIQWLFPLETPSSVHPEVPTLDEAVIHIFRDDSRIQHNLGRSLTVMLNFYGLEHEPAGESKLQQRQCKITPRPDYPARSANWLHPGNHNHLRLTRMLHCLSLCGLKSESQGLLTCLLQIGKDAPEAISSTTLRFWQQAL